MRLTSPRAIGLFFLAPLVAEYLLGNMPITWLPLMLVVAPMYGGGALLVRETARRLRLGWPGILMLALAYAIIEEALVTQSLFNPDYLKLRLLDFGFVSSLGIGAWWTVFVLGVHVVWSIATPIAVCEALAGEDSHEPWLGPVGLAGAITVFVAGCAVLARFQLSQDPFRAPVSQLTASVGVVLVLLAAALLVAPRLARTAKTHPDAKAAPSPRSAGIVALVFASSFMLVATRHGSLPVTPVVAALLVTLGAGAWLLFSASRKAGWTPRHEVSVAGGALMTYAWYGFLQVPSVGAPPWWLDAFGNAVFAAGAIWLLIKALQRTA